MKFNGKVYDEIFHPVEEDNNKKVDAHVNKPDPKAQEKPQKEEKTEKMDEVTDPEAEEETDPEEQEAEEANNDSNGTDQDNN